MRKYIDIISEATIADYPAGTAFLISGSQQGRNLASQLMAQGINVEDVMISVDPAEAQDPNEYQATVGKNRPGQTGQAFRDADGQLWVYYGGATSMNSSFVHADKLANRGEIAEGILGAAMFAKFTKRAPAEEIAQVSVSDIERVLNSLKQSGDDTYETQVQDADNRHADTVKFVLTLKTKPYQDLMDTGKRDALKNEFASAAAYVNTPMAERYSRYFYLNGRADEISVISTGAASETSSKVDVYVEVNGRRLKLNTSLKVGGIKQFGQVGGSETASMIKLWRYFGVDVTPYVQEFEQKRERDQFEALEYMYRSIADQLSEELAGDNDTEEAKFVNNVAHAVTFFATLGDPNVELVDFSKGGFKILRFKNLVEKMRTVNLTASYKENKGRPEIGIHDVENPKRELVSVRVKIENKKDGPYVRNIVEKGPLLEEIAKVQERGWSEMSKKLDDKIAALDQPQADIRPTAAPRARRDSPKTDAPRQRR